MNEVQVDQIKNEEWSSLLHDEMQKPYFKFIAEELKRERGKYRVFPPKGMIYTALELTSFSKVKVVILGQDPYHQIGQAHGLSFSVPAGQDFPPSLRNIFKELQSDLNAALPMFGDLSKWANQGVLLLNSVITVREGDPGSHAHLGWQQFTDSIVRLISEEKDHVVFVLWGKYAASKAQLIDKNRHCILSGPHPSPLSAYRGFFGSKPFSKANIYLKQHGHETIDWADF
ncbi:MAG: uracil-DNA glycosylase [Salibacteraceae bacterium]